MHFNKWTPNSLVNNVQMQFVVFEGSSCFLHLQKCSKLKFLLSLHKVETVNGQPRAGYNWALLIFRSILTYCPSHHMEKLN